MFQRVTLSAYLEPSRECYSSLALVVELLDQVGRVKLLAGGVFEWYKANLQRGINYIRWYEYALSSSVMIVIIAELSGIYDLSSAIMIFCLNAAMNLFGLMMELHNQTTARTDWTSFIFGSFIGLIPWVVICMYFFSAAASATGTVPTFVYYILGTIFVFFNCFAINMVLQYRKVGKWRDYIFGERVYVLLSLVAKSALAWQIFFGAVARNLVNPTHSQSRNAQASAWAFLLPASHDVSVRDPPPLHQIVCDIAQANLT